MKLIKMTANFGKLEGAVLEFHDGLNVVTAPNEGGKSTWAAFVRAMFYGFPARDRDKAGHLAEKNRYLPWSGAPMAGMLELEWHGRSITLVRGPKNGVPWGAFSAVYTATQEKVEGLTGENCGELLLGISREVFERTAFVGQDGALLTPSADLEKRVAALAASGEEAVSVSQVERRLKDWQNHRRSNSRTGRIPELEEELNTVLQARRDQEALLCRAQEARQKQEASEKKRDKLAEGLLARSSRCREEAQSDRASAAAAWERAHQALLNTPPTEQLRAAQGEVSMLNSLRSQQLQAERELPQLEQAAAEAAARADQDPWFGGTDPVQAAARAQADEERVRALEKRGLPFLLMVLGALLGGAAGWLLLPELTPVLPAVIGALVLGLVGAVLLRRRKREAARLLARYEAKTPEDILERSRAFTALADEARQALDRLEQARQHRRELTRLQTEKTGALLALVHTFAPEVTEVVGAAAAISRALQQGENLRLARVRLEAAEQLLSTLPEEGAAAVTAGDGGELEAAERQLAADREAAARLFGELNAQPDPVELSVRESELREELEQRRQEYAALTLALDGLLAADNRLRERFSPALNRRAGEYLAALTGGRYEAAVLTREFRALARPAGDGEHRPDLSLSCGTAQQLYLALRLALCDLALPESEPCPVLLDDVLVAFDEERTGLALKVLEELGERRQVILFTCREPKRA